MFLPIKQWYHVVLQKSTHGQAPYKPVGTLLNLSAFNHKYISALVAMTHYSQFTFVGIQAVQHCSHGCVSSYMLHAMEQLSFVPRTRLQSNFWQFMLYEFNIECIPHYSHKLVYCLACTWPEMYSI